VKRLEEHLSDFMVYEINKDVIDLAKPMISRVREDKDLVIGLCGAEGDGKSTLAIQLGLACDPSFNLRDNELYAPTENEVKEKLLGLPKYSVLVADEAIKILYKLRHSSRMQIFLNTLYALARKENKITILCMPRFRDFNEFFRNHRIKIWIQIIERGVAVVFVKDKSPFSKDPWWLDQNQKIVDKATRNKRIIEYGTYEMIEVLKRCRLYYKTIHFDPLPENIKDEYENLRDAVKYNDIELERTTESERLLRYRRAMGIITAYLMKQKTTEIFISRLTGVPQSHLSKLYRRFRHELDTPDIKKLIESRIQKV